MYGKFKTRLDAFWHSYFPPKFFLKNPFTSAKSFQFMSFSEAMFYENYLTSEFPYKYCYFRRVCLLVKMASKIVIRPIVCDDKGYSHRLVGVGGVFRSYSVGTWDTVN